MCDFIERVGRLMLENLVRSLITAAIAALLIAALGLTGLLP